MKYVYPAIFEKDEEAECYNVSFPNLPGCLTFGKDLDDVYFMASDALALYLYTLEDQNAKIPAASEIGSIKATKGQIVSFVSCDTLDYREKFDNRLVNKTVTIEAWLNKMAEAAHINCSRLLRKALKEELGIR